MTGSRSVPVSWRLPVLAAGGVALAAGLYAALLLLGVPLPAPSVPLAEVHGPLMVLGFVGTLIALERAVALGTRWALLAPAASGTGGLLLVLTGPGLAARILLMAAAVALLALYRELWRRQPGMALLAQVAGALSWYAATLLWLAGFPVAEIVPWLAGFVVATIAGERFELARVALSPTGRRWFPVALAALLAGASATALWPDTGPHLFGAGLLAVVAWLAVFDVARHTVRATGLPRYVAVGLLTGYGWLGLAGLLWLVAGPTVAGPRYDATLHAVFLGFTLSMIFVHAPVILPAVLRRPLPYRPLLYLPLALLHTSLLLRIGVGDLLKVEPVWRWAGVANVVAVLGFVGCAGAGFTRHRPPPVTGQATRQATGQATQEAMQEVSGRVTRPATGRAGWHRRVAALPLAYLVGLVVLAFVHPFLPEWRWLAIHLFLLGVATNAIVIWSAHFTVAVLRAPASANRRAETARLAALNAGVLAVLTGGATDLRWLGVGGAAVLFAALATHLGWLAARLRSALPNRLSVTVRYYLAATLALGAGVPVGAWMLVVDDRTRPRLLLFHAHVNLLGWVTLTVLGTLLTLWPTILRTRMAEYAVRAATVALPLVVTGLVLLGTGLLLWSRTVIGAGQAMFVLGAVVALRPAVAAARARPPAAFAGWSVAAAGGWLFVALAVDGWTLLTAGGPEVAAGRFASVLVPLLVGFAAQVLLGALTYLLPVVLGGGPDQVRRRTAALDRHWPQRVAMGNGALAVFVLPSPPFVRITTSLLVLVALAQFLVPAVRVLLLGRGPSYAETDSKGPFLTPLVRR